MKNFKMKNLTLKLTIGILILILFSIIGGTYAFLSHETHVKLGIDFGLSHITHLIIGYSLIGLGILIFILTLVTDFLKSVNKYGQRFWYVFIIMDILKWILIVVLGLIVLSGGAKVAQSII